MQLGSGVGYSGQHRPSRHLGVGGVALTLAVSSGPVRPVDLDDGNAPTGQEPGQSGAVGTGAFDSEGANFSQARDQRSSSPYP